MFSGTLQKLLDLTKDIKNISLFNHKRFDKYKLKSIENKPFIFNPRYFQNNIEIDNSITVIENGPGLINILSNSFRPQPDYVYINNIVIDLNTYNQVNLIDEEENTIKMKWNSKLSALKEMFNSCDKLISIDLSDFDTTLVPIIETMFQSCLIQKNAINDCSNPCFNEPTIFNLEDENC